MSAGPHEAHVHVHVLSLLLCRTYDMGEVQAKMVGLLHITPAGSYKAQAEHLLLQRRSNP